MDDETFKLLFLAQLYRRLPNSNEDSHVRTMQNRFWTSLERRGAYGDLSHKYQLKRVEDALFYMKELALLAKKLIKMAP